MPRSTKRRNTGKIMTLAAILALLKPFLLPLVSLVAGWLLPSPIKKSRDLQEKTHNAESKADETRGFVDDLDKLP